MALLVDTLLSILGLGLLLAGGETLVLGARGLALRARVSPAVIGLTVVAAGTSMPELVVSVRGALTGETGLAAGNIVGSNIFNIAAILGAAALARPLRIAGNSVRFEWPVMLAACLAFHATASGGVIGRLEGTLLLAGMAGFMTYAVWVARAATTAAERDEFAEAIPGPPRRSWAADAALAVLGVALLAGGSVVLVEGAAGLAAGLGVSATVIGLTVVSAGTSAPELITSVLAARRGHDDIAVANVLGSNVFNCLAIAGTTAVVTPLSVPPEVTARDDLWMLGFALLLLPVMRSGMRIGRAEGAVLLGGWVVYVGWLISSS